MRTWWAALVAAGLLLGCGGSGNEGGNDGGGQPASSEAAAQTASADPDDACTLVSQSEMERFIGPLLEAPYRVRNRRPNPTGDGCLYRARDYRNVTIVLDRESGELSFRMLAGVGGQIEDVLGGADMSADTLEVDWDKVGRAFGQLIALKGPVSVHIDPLGSRLDLAAQAKIMSIAIGRLDAPLKYDGGRATSRRKDVAMAPRDPCSLVTKAEAESLMGELRADPHPSDEGDACVFPLAGEFFGTPADRSLEVQWSDGFYALGQDRQAMGGAAKAMATVMGPDIPALGENAAGEKEPWDERITLMGGMITVIKHDVLLKIPADGMGGFNEDKALALLRIAANRI